MSNVLVWLHMIHCQKELFGINVGQAFCTRRFITDKQKDGLLQTFEGKVKMKSISSDMPKMFSNIQT